MFLAVCMLYIAVKGYQANNNYGGSSTIICGIIFLFFSYYNSIFGFFNFPFTGFMSWWIGIWFILNLIFALVIRRIMKKLGLNNKDQNVSKSVNLNNSILQKFILLMIKDNPYTENISFKMECVRKSFHLSGLLLVISYFGFFFIPPLLQTVNENIIIFINDTKWLYNLLWEDTRDYPYDKNDFQAVIDITMFGLMGFLVFAIICELFRIIWGPEYSILNFLTRSVLRKKEVNAVGAQIYLISGIIFSYMLYVVGLIHIYIFMTGMLIACFSDALAALIGRKYGKHKVKCIGGEIKSIEGFIAGTGSAFLIGFIILGPIYGLIAALIFFLLDYFPTVIADNILNPIVITVSLLISVILLGFPIGWF